MVKLLKFCWLCLREAGLGSIDIANAWQGLLGTFVLFAFGYWRGGAVMIPDKVDEYALIFGFASLGIAWLCVFAFQLAGAPAKLYWAEHAKAKELSEQLRIAQKQFDANDTKWTIGELFQHIDPDFLENKHWEKIGDELRDALSEGRLTMWGRLKETDSGPWVGPRAALAPIEKTYWYKAYFTYFFFHEQTNDGVHCYADRKTGRPAYTDLQVNRSEALVIWPGESDDIAEGYPNVRVADSPAVIDLFEGKDRAKLIALLAGEKITTWARHGMGVANDLLKRSGQIWKDNSFRFDPKREGTGTINQTFLTARARFGASYYDVCFNYAQLKRIWPLLSITRTKCDTR